MHPSALVKFAFPAHLVFIRIDIGFHAGSVAGPQSQPSPGDSSKWKTAGWLEFLWYEKHNVTISTCNRASALFPWEKKKKAWMHHFQQETQERTAEAARMESSPVVVLPQSGGPITLT